MVIFCCVSAKKSSTLEIKNEAYDDCAGIGSDSEHDGGKLVVHGGTINAKGSGWGAGIGGGKDHGFSPSLNTGGLIVYGGKVRATAVKGAAGIGSSCDCKDMAGYILIYGGDVYAEGGRYDAVVTYEGAGIGGGDESPGGIVHIYGGTVTAKGAIYGAGIGGGCDARGTYTHIHGGTVTATSEKGAGIGGGKDGSGGEIVIDGGTVIATSELGAGIGTGHVDAYTSITTNATITINGGTVTATSKENGAGIGGGRVTNPH